MNVTQLLKEAFKVTYIVVVIPSLPKIRNRFGANVIRPSVDRNLKCLDGLRKKLHFRL